MRLNILPARLRYVGSLALLLVVVGAFVFGAPGRALADFAGSIVTDGAVSHWNFEESSGNLIDQIGATDGTMVGTPTREQVGQVGFAYTFTPNQGINLPDNVFNSHTQGAIEAIVKPGSATGTYVIFGMGDSASSTNNRLFLRIFDGRLQLLVRTNGTTRAFIQSATTLNAGEYYHIVAQVGVGGAQMFVNGVEDTPYTTLGGSVANTSWFSDTTAAATISRYSIGYWNNLSPQFYFNGSIDEVAIYDATKAGSVWLDHYDAAFGATTIGVSSPLQFQTFQRDDTGHANIPITGSYTGTPTAIEARFNGGAWTTIDAAPAGGTYTGTLSGQTAGQGALEVRFTNDVLTNNSVADVGIGDVYVVAGQSNGSGRGDNPQTYSHATLKATVFDENTAWKEANDPVSVDTADGSVWPLLASHILESQDVPVAFIVRTEGGTGILAPDDNWAKGGSDTPRMYEPLISQVTASGVNAVKGVLWWQGEREAAAAKSQADYLAGLNTLIANFAADLPGAPKTMVAQIGEQASPTDDQIDAIRLAQAQAWVENDNVFVGPVFYDLDLVDDLHLTTDGQMQTGADRWWAAIEAAYYGGSDGVGPVFSSAEENADRTAVTVSFSENTPPIAPSTDIEGFRVQDDGVDVTILSATSSGNDVTLTLQDALTGTATVSLGHGNAAVGLDVPTDSSAFTLPAQPFISEAVALASHQGGGGSPPPPPVTPAVRVVSPNGSETLASGSVVPVEWVTQGRVDLVNVAYSIDGGTTWYDLVRGGTNDGRYQWTVPNVASTQVLVRVEATDNAVVFASDASDAVFTIVKQDESLEPPVQSDDEDLTPGDGDPTAAHTPEGQPGSRTNPANTLAPGTFVRTLGTSTVYRITPDFAREPVLDSRTFFTHESSFGIVTYVTDAAMKSAPLAPPVLPEPGTMLITFWGDPDVYVIQNNPNDIRRHLIRRIDSEAEAEALAGVDWRDYVVDYNTAFRTLFIEGAPMLPGETINRSMLIRRDTLSERAGIMRAQSFIERMGALVRHLLTR